MLDWEIVEEGRRFFRKALDALAMHDAGMSREEIMEALNEQEVNDE